MNHITSLMPPDGSVTEPSTILTRLAAHAMAHPTRPCLLIQHAGLWQQFSFADMQSEVERWANLIAEAVGQPRGDDDIIFIIIDHRAEAYPAYLGAMHAGFTPAFLAYPTPKQDAELYWQTHSELLNIARPAAILSYQGALPKLGSLTAAFTCVLLDIDVLARATPRAAIEPVLRQSCDIALLQYSSGTTGLRKGVALSFGQIDAQIGAFAQAIRATKADRIVSWLPLYHDMGLFTAFLMPLSLGAMVIAIDAFDWLARPSILLELIDTYQASLCWLPNFAFNHLLRTRDETETFSLASMRAFIDCSEPCRPETLLAFAEGFAHCGLRPESLQICYGMAEAVFAVTQTSPGHMPRTLSVDSHMMQTQGRAVIATAQTKMVQNYLSCGVPVEGVQLRIAGCDEGEEGFVGEIEITAPFLFSYYHRNEQASRAAFNGDWYKTGDLGFIHQGELFVCGRTKELVTVHGRNFYAHDIEAAVAGVAGVKPGRVVAFGIDDSVTASEEIVVLAEVDHAADFDQATIKRSIRQHIFDRLELTVKHVELRDLGSLIKTSSGKLSRRENQARYLASKTGKSP